MFKKILIANRGEIACRVAQTARRLGVRTVAVYSEADAQAAHVGACDEAVPIGGHAAKDSYLQWQRILEAAKATGAQAVHPGYGFLSENEDFARACAAAGLVFIGPPPEAIAAMGSKAAAKALMAEAGVPLVPGYHGDNNDPQFLLGQAEAIGFPVLIKASAGGGGRGMRRWTAPRTSSPPWPPASARPPPASATTMCWWSATSPARATSRSRSSPTPRASASTCSSATARCSAATRRCWKRRPPRPVGRAPRRDGRRRRGRRPGRGLCGRGHGGVHRRGA
jgi:hypothetical protein